MQENEARRAYKQVIGKSLKRIDITVNKVNKTSFEELKKMYRLPIAYSYSRPLLPEPDVVIYPKNLEKVIRKILNS